MSQENVEAARRGYQALESDDRSAFQALLHPDVTWYPVLGLLTNQASYHGPEAVAKLLFEEAPSVLEGFRNELLELQDLGDDAVLSVFRAKGKSASSGLEIEQTFFQVLRIRDSKAIESRSYTTRAAALEAAGMSE